VHGPVVWNSLPDDLRAQQDYESFRQGLKTWLFSRYYSVFSALETFVIIALYKSTFTIAFTIEGAVQMNKLLTNR